jgi:hypothetical protein
MNRNPNKKESYQHTRYEPRDYLDIESKKSPQT